MPCVPTEAVTVLGAVDVLVVIVDVSCDFGGRVGGCVSACRDAAVIRNKLSLTQCKVEKRLIFPQCKNLF